MRYSILVWVSMLALLSAACSSVETRQLGDGTTQQFGYVQGMPAQATNDWATVKEADLLIGQKEDGSGADFWWGFRLDAKIAMLNSVTVYDVTEAPPTLIIEDPTPMLADNTWSGETQKQVLSEATVPWLFEAGTSERVFQLLLRDKDGREKSLYQPSIYDEQTKKALRRAVFDAP